MDRVLARFLEFCKGAVVSPSPSKLIALGVQKVLLPTRTCLTQTGASCCKTFLEGMFPCMSFVFTLSRHGFARRGPKLGCKSACFSHVAAHASSNHSSWFPPVPLCFRRFLITSNPFPPIQWKNPREPSCQEKVTNR